MSIRAEVQETLSRYSFTGPLSVFRPEVSVSSGPPYPRRNGPVHCEVAFVVPERDSGKPYTVRTAFVVRHGSPDTDCHRALVRAVLDRLTHEALESIRFDGKLFADPHQRRSWREFVDVP